MFPAGQAGAYPVVPGPAWLASPLPLRTRQLPPRCRASCHGPPFCGGLGRSLRHLPAQTHPPFPHQLWRWTAARPVRRRPDRSVPVRQRLSCGCVRYGKYAGERLPPPHPARHPAALLQQRERQPHPARRSPQGRTPPAPFFWCVPWRRRASRGQGRASPPRSSPERRPLRQGALPSCRPRHWRRCGQRPSGGPCAAKRSWPARQQAPLQARPQPARRPPPPLSHPPYGGCGVCGERSRHRLRRHSCGGKRVPRVAGKKRIRRREHRPPPRPSQGNRPYRPSRQRGIRFLQAFPDGMSYHSLWDCCPQSKNVCSHRTRGAAAPQGNGHAAQAVRGCENPSAAGISGRGPAPASRGLSVKISSSARKNPGGRGSGAYGPTSRNLPSIPCRGFRHPPRRVVPQGRQHGRDPDPLSFPADRDGRARRKAARRCCARPHTRPGPARRD